jgi:hypothetical protein
MAWIFDRYIYSRRFQIGREEFLRPLPFGTNWQTVRIGVRFSVNDSARSTYAGGNWGYGMYLGVAQGASTSFLADTVTDWIGGGYIGSTAQPSGQLAFNAGSPNYYLMNLGRPNALRKTGSSYTFTAESSVSIYIVGSGENAGYGNQLFCGCYVDIVKGSPYTITIYYTNSAANAQTNLTEAAFLTNMESGGTPTLTAVAGAKTLAYTGAGLFDTLSIVCPRSWPSTEIGTLAVVRYT